ncbi:ribonuclease T1 [Crucibulum laeve]|uniref:Ribonuclease T1 n=1 Tax=Crucibulum laeve TaxID=68775 RepID=A0A5C3M6Z0_9AGAR|nr:ribonuclease T1 [Crucibulum laeve]
MKWSALLILLAFTTYADALVLRRQAKACTCAGRRYSATDIANGIKKAEGGGASDYPHQYHDFEDFPFSTCSGEFFEFPILSGSTYNGGSPGADRVIYDQRGDFCGEV